MAELDIGRPASDADAVDGVLPGRVLEPETPAHLAAMLGHATAAGRSTIVRGCGTKLGWGRVPAAVDQVLSTAHLTSPLVHRDGDLTATAGAGVRLAALNAQLGQRGQWLPVDSAFDATSIGGLIATNESGPVRHRYGTPRDLLIGVTLALADGRIVKAGGTVVKNVAGYDLGRFVSGSLGAVAVVLDATFKLAPLPKSSATVRRSFDTPAALGAACASLTASQLDPAAVDVRVARDAPGGTVTRDLLACFATSPGATAAQVDALCAGWPDASVISGGEEGRLWQDQVALPWRGGVTLRFGWLPASLAEVVDLVESSCADLPSFAFAGRAGVGAGFLRLDGETGAQVQVVERLRRSTCARHVVVLAGGREVKAAVDVWGDALPWGQALAALKRTLDPAGILGGGRGPV